MQDQNETSSALTVDRVALAWSVPTVLHSHGLDRLATCRSMSEPREHNDIKPWFGLGRNGDVRVKEKDTCFHRSAVLGDALLWQDQPTIRTYIILRNGTIQWRCHQPMLFANH